MISQLRFAPPFSNHAVLQRDRPIAVWGTAPPAKVVTVRLSDSAARVTAGLDGSWLVRLPALPAGGPYELVASTDGDEVRIVDVLIGELWIGSGQSNMEGALNQTSQGLSETESNLPGIRALTVHTPARLGRLNLGAIDKHDDTYVEGERVGGLSWEDGEDTWCTPRVYRLPAHLVKGDALNIAVRVRSHCCNLLIIRSQIPSPGRRMGRAARRTSKCAG